MKVLLLILAIGLVAVVSKPTASDRATKQIPCGGTANIESCECGDYTIVTPNGPGCTDGPPVSCTCKPT